MSSDVPSYRIGAVARLTGLSPHVIRAWERRYDAVSPARSEGGTRLYTADDVERLSLLKALGDRGETLAALTGLSLDALRRRARLPANAASSRIRLPLRAAVLGRALADLLHADVESPVSIQLCCDDLEAFERAVHCEPVELLVIDLARLGDDPVATFAACLRKSRAGVGLVAYDFAPRVVLTQLADAGARLIRGPLRGSDLRRALFDLIETAAEPPGRRFSDAELRRLREVGSAVGCECPNHLSSIISSLIAFERYSRSCHVEHPEDAALHRVLARETSDVRRTMEELLGRVCEVDGIPA